MGPSGFISMEDGAATGFVQRAVRSASDHLSVVEMGGAASPPTRAASPRRRCAASGRPIGAHGDVRRRGNESMTSSCSSRSRTSMPATSEAIDDNQLEAWPDFFRRRWPLPHHHGGQCRARAADRPDVCRPRAPCCATACARCATPMSTRRSAIATSLGAPFIEPVGDGTVRAQTSFMVARIMHTGETMLFATGRYDDRIVLADRRRRALRREGRGSRQPADRHAAGDSAVADRQIAVCPRGGGHTPCYAIKVTSHRI